MGACARTRHVLDHSTLHYGDDDESTSGQNAGAALVTVELDESNIPGTALSAPYKVTPFQK